MRQDHAAFYLSLCLVIMEQVRGTEQPKSARWNVMNNLMDRVEKSTDIYRMEGWRYGDIHKACRLCDKIDAKVKQLYPLGRIRRASTYRRGPVVQIAPTRHYKKGVRQL